MTKACGCPEKNNSNWSGRFDPPHGEPLTALLYKVKTWFMVQGGESVGIGGTSFPPGEPGREVDD